QVWFPGVHSDVGGGYEDSRLSDLALEWMIQEATAISDPLQVDEQQRSALKPAYDGLQHDQRRGFGRFWIKGTREAYKPEVLCDKHVENRFKLAAAERVGGAAPYRPAALSQHRAYAHYYAAPCPDAVAGVGSLAPATC